MRLRSAIVAYLAPVNGIEFSVDQLPKGELDAIKSVLAKRGEQRETAKLWWVGNANSYYVLIKTSEGEATATYSVSLENVVKEQQL